MNKTRKHFKFYIEYMQIFNMLSYRQQNKLLAALCNYVSTGVIPDNLRKKTQTVFYKLKPIIDGDNEWERIRQERAFYGKRGANKRWNGKK